MMKTTLRILVVALLCSVVAYLAIDRKEKNMAQQHTREFKSKYIK